MKAYLLVINAGSATVKFSLFSVNPNDELALEFIGKLDQKDKCCSFTVKREDGTNLAERGFASDDGSGQANGMFVIQTWLHDYLPDSQLVAIGHRVVHGGVKYSAPALVDETVLADLDKLIPLAPLHQPHNLAYIKAFKETLPHVPQVACFDTAFHRSQPEIAQRFALPRQYFDKGIRRYGFHGISYEYVSYKLNHIDPSLYNAKIIVAHLGNGSSLCAIKDGKSITTTMGFSTLDGLMMGTRCGQIDPGVLLYLLQHDKFDATALEQLLYHESGLLAVSGISSDMRALLASNEPNAQEAIDLYVYRVVREIGSLTAALGGLDALVFTGGIGENSAEIRSRICVQIGWLGLEIDESLNAANSIRISTNNSKIAANVINTDENLMIALQTQKLLGL